MERYRYESPRGESPNVYGFAGKDAARIERSLAKIVGAEGIPHRLPVEDWRGVLGELANAVLLPRRRWPESLGDRIRGLVLATLRFARPDGSAVFGPGTTSADLGSLLRAWAEALEEPGVATVVRWWFGRGGRSQVQAPPLPAFGGGKTPIAMLRADWRADGDLLAVDHRIPGSGSSLELRASGKTLLGPSWAIGLGTAGPARVVGWSTGMHADWAEWSFRVGEARVVRTAVLLRGRKLALLAEEWRGAVGEVSTRYSLAPGVGASLVADSRALSLKVEGVSARAIPLGLPALPYATERGSLSARPGELTLTQKADAGRLWLPLLCSWDKGRNRRIPRWRRLTVSERSKNCAPGVAFAARIGWGPGDGLVVYRSLARPTPRTFLGHQTSARFLVGLFTEKGDVVPLLKVDE